MTITSSKFPGREFKSVDECLSAEAEYDLKIAEEKAKAKEKQEAREARRAEVQEAFENYTEKAKAFLEDYGRLELGWTDKCNETPLGIFDVFNLI